MAQAARAYRLDAYPDVVEERFSSSDVRAVRTGAAPVGKPQTTPIVVIGRAAAVLLVVVAVLCFARIALTNAAVTTMIESDAISGNRQGALDGRFSRDGAEPAREHARYQVGREAAQHGSTRRGGHHRARR